MKGMLLNKMINRKFIRRLSAFSLAVVITVSGVPVTALAEGDKVIVNDEKNTESSGILDSFFGRIKEYKESIKEVLNTVPIMPTVVDSYSPSVTAGEIRYVTQNPNSSGGYYHPEYWSGISDPSWRCNLAAWSMALSYLGVNKYPNSFSNNAYNCWPASHSGINSDKLETMIAYYLYHGASPVVFHINSYPKSGGGTTEHWMIIDGYLGGNRYHVEDPWDKSVTEVSINNGIISGSTRGGRSFSSAPDTYFQYWYEGANLESIKTCMDDVASKYNSANNTIYIQGWAYSTKGNKVTFKAQFDNGTTINLANRNDPGIKGAVSGCSRDDVRFYDNIDVSFLSPNANHKVTVTAYSSTGKSAVVGSYSFKTANFTVNTNSAENITNSSATISGSVSPAGTVSGWGFYYGEGTDASKKVIVSNANTSTNKLSCDMKIYAGKLKSGKTYSYKIWVKSGSAEIVSKQVKSFVTTSVKPDNSEITIADEYTDIGIEGSPIVSWKAIDNADSYTLRLYDSSGDLIQEEEGITGTQYGFNPILEEGEYYASVTTVNEVGSGDENKSLIPIRVHPDVKVTFVDYDDTVVCEQTIHYGYDAERPVDLEREGHTFKGWDSDYSSVKEDVVIKAVYEINHYKVIFKDENGNVLSEQTVDYDTDAEEPAYAPARAEYALYGWDKNTKNVKENMVITAVVGWYNTNFPIYLQEATATRNFEGSVNEGYDVTVKFKNWDKGTTRGRVIVALKTDEGKLLTTTESSAFSIKKNDTKSMDIFVPYEGAAKKAYIYVVERYSDMIPLSSELSVDIDQGLEWSDWSEEQPPVSALETESRTEYRYSDLKTTKSYDTSMAGWDMTGSRWVKSGSGTVDYAKSWPSGFNTGNYYYGHYRQTPPVASETANTKRTVSTYVDHYLYWHWCRGSYSGGPINRSTRPYYTGEFHEFHAFISASNATTAASDGDGSYQFSNAGCCRDSYWYYKIPIYRTTYTDYKKQYTYEKWDDFTAWDVNVVTASSTRKVETRTAYRYKTNDLTEDNSGESRTIAGKISITELSDLDTVIDDSVVDDSASEYLASVECDDELQAETDVEADSIDELIDDTICDEIVSEEVEEKSLDLVEGDQKDESPSEDTAPASKKLNAILTVYKVDSASDYTTECVAQGEIADDGSYSFNIKLKEEPTAKTGDFTVTLGVEGSDKAVELEPIKAPAATYTVRFLDWDGRVISSQSVREGDSAEVPSEENMLRDGYIFRRWSLPNTNIHKDTDIVAEYIQKTYHVVFVDWAAKSVVEEEHKYGDELIAPVPKNKDDSLVASWDKIDAGITTVTSNMVVCTVYKPRKCEVKIYDSKYSLVSTQQVDYGTAPDLSVVETEGSVDIDWEICGSDNIYEDLLSTVITDNAKIRALEVYDEQVVTPTCSLESGEYNSSKTVSLLCETEGAEIFYTTDGTTPTKESEKYSTPITINQTTTLKCVAIKSGYRMSNENVGYYVINTNPEHKQHLVRVVKGNSDLDEFFFVDDGVKFNKNMVSKPRHASIVSLYEDEDMKTIWNENGVINSSVTLYARCDEDSYVVEFVDSEGKMIYKEATIYGGAVASPMIPELVGLVAVGWDSDEYNYVTRNLIIKPIYSDGTDDSLDTDVEAKLNKSELTLSVGETYNLLADVNKGFRSLNWVSDNLSVAKVSQYGKVTATGVGTTTIRLSVVGSNAIAECKVTVIDGLVTKQKTDISGCFNTTEPISRYVVLPKGYASVDKKNILKAKKEGLITVTAQKKEGKKYIDLETIHFNIKTPKFEKVTIIKRDQKVDLNNYLSNTSGVNCMWSTPKNSKVATITEDGILSINKSGNQKIILTFGEGKNAAVYKTTVKISLPKLSKTKLNLKNGRSSVLKVKNTIIKPSAWISSDATIATVEDGVVNAIKPGTTTISAIIDGEEYSCIVIVK